jgi:hypothetical protein
MCPVSVNFNVPDAKSHIYRFKGEGGRERERGSEKRKKQSGNLNERMKEEYERRNRMREEGV